MSGFREPAFRLTIVGGAVMRDLFSAAGAWGQCARAALILRGRPALNFTVSVMWIPVQYFCLSSMHTSRLIVVLLLAP